MPLTGCRIFDGIDDSLVTATPLDLSGTPVITLLARFWWNAYSTNADALIDFGGQLDLRGMFRIYPNSPYGAYFEAQMSEFDGGGNANLQWFDQPAPGQWHSLGLVLNRSLSPASAEMALYIDGVLMPGTVTFSQDCTGNFGSAKLTLMAVAEGAGQWGAGRLADVAIYGSALSADVMRYYALGAAGHTFGSPIAYWPLSGAESPEPDLVGLHPLTVHGTTQGAPPDVLTGARVVAVASGHVTIGGNGSLFVGEDVMLALESPSVEQAPVNLDGYTVQFEVKTSDTAATALLSKAATIAGTYSATRAANTQRALVTLTDTETATLTGGSVYRHSWKRQDAGAERVLAYGFFYPERATQL